MDDNANTSSDNGDSENSLPLRNIVLGVAGACAVTFIWSLWIVTSRYATTRHGLLPTDIVFLRFTTAFILISPFIYHYWPRHLPWKQVIGVGVGIGVLYALPSIIGLQYATAAHAGVFTNGLIPVFSAVIGYMLFQVKLQKVQIIALPLFIIGCALVGWKYISFEHWQIWYGTGLILISTIFISFHIAYTSVVKVKPMETVVVTCTLNGVGMCLVWLLFLPTNIPETPISAVAFHAFYQALGPSISGLFFTQLAVNYIGKIGTSAILALVPGVTAIMAVFILQESIDILTGLGIIVTITGILLANNIFMYVHKTFKGMKS